MRRLVLTLGSLLLACGDPPDLDECEALALADCDIREAACQEHYSAVLRCVRGDDQPTPTLTVLSEEAYKQRYADGGGPPGEATALDRALALVGLLPDAPPGEWVVPAARYDFEAREVVVVDTGAVRAQLRAISQAHADAAVDFLALETDSDDQEVASVGLFLGETIFYGDAAYYKTAAETAEAFRGRIADNLYYGLEQTDAMLVARLPDYDYRALGTAFAVGFGADAVLAAWLEGGPAAVRAGYDPLVRSAAQILEYALGEPRELAMIEPPRLPPELAVVAADRLGPWLLHAIEMRALGVSEDTPVSLDFDLASQVLANWRGDALFVVEDAAAGAVGLVLTVALADPKGWVPDGDDWQVAANGREASLVRAESVELKAALVEAVSTGTRSKGAVPRTRRSAAVGLLR